MDCRYQYTANEREMTIVQKICHNLRKFVLTPRNGGRWTMIENTLLVNLTVSGSSTWLRKKNILHLHSGPVTLEQVITSNK